MANKPLNTELLHRAIIFAVHAHAGSERRGKGYPYIVHPMEAVEIVAAIDRLSKASHDAEIGDTLWNRFHAKDHKDHEWHYRGLAEALRELSDTFAYQEFERLINQVFQS